jgi:hypothetical protein
VVVSRAEWRSATAGGLLAVSVSIACGCTFAADFPDLSSGEDAGGRDGANRSCEGSLGGVCDLPTQCGCSGGFRCVLLGGSDMLEACVPTSSNPIPAGNRCERSATWTVDECVAGTQCIHQPGRGFECTKFCSWSSVDECGSQGYCFAVSSLDTVGLCLAVTSQRCDPTRTVENGCPAGEACIVVGKEDDWDQTVCFPAGGGDSLTGCGGGRGCLSGYHCEGQHCSKYCRPGDPDAGIPAADCEVWEGICEERWSQLNKLGVCLLPYPSPVLPGADGG